MIKIALIGAGNQSNKVHYPSLASFDDVEMAAICDIDTERMNSTANKYGIQKRFSDFRLMIKEVAPDGVYAIGPPHIMYDIWTWCLERGINLCIEKPMGITIHQARSLAYLAKKSGSITQVSFQRRSCPMVMLLRDECLKRGPIIHAICTFYKNEITPYTVARDHMMDDGVHAIDTLRWICGGDVIKVESITRRIQVPDINFIAATLNFDNGSTGILVNSWSSGRRIFKVEMHAPGICVEAEHEDKGYLYADGNTDGKMYKTSDIAGSKDLYAFGGFKTKNRQFVDALKSKKQPESSFFDALKTMEVAETILAQSVLSETSQS